MTTETALLARAKNCVHHWVVRPPEGPTSWGSCRKCGKRKRFLNRFDGRDRNNNSDLFVDGTRTWKPDRRATYYEPRIAEAFEEARLATAGV
ncbi:MAG: hypothetical protein V3V06_05735 [Dehalococcoidia bacterium]